MANPLNDEDQAARENVRYLNEQLLKNQTLVELRQKQLKLEKDINLNNELSAKLSEKQKDNAKKYIASFEKLGELEKRYYSQQLRGDSDGAKRTKTMMDLRKKQQEQLLKTEGGYRAAQESAYRKRLIALTAEQRLIQDINKKKTEGTKLEQIGNRIKNLFVSKEEKQRQIDAARAAVGGGANKPPGSPPGTVGGKDAEGPERNLGGKVSAALLASLIAGVKQLKKTISTIGNEIKTQLLKPFSEAANLVSGNGLGIGGGAVSGAGATSILGGLSNIAKTLPFVGGLVGGLVDGFKTVLDTVLGIDSANTRFAKSLGISKKDAVDLKKTYIDIANASGSLVVNQTRLMESQVELSQQLGVNNNLSGDILATNIELKEVLGLEVEARKSIAQSSIITGRNEKEVTKSVLGQVALFKGLTGIGFNFKDILGEAAKQTGVIGLRFAKYPEQLTKTLLTVKSLGMSLKQVDDIAGGLVDFESSISKEFEAQVLLGRNINLTKAREAALNNDLATVSSEITKNVGDAGSFLKLNRIQQDAIAQSVGMTRDSLADTLKQQEAFTKLGAKDLKQANEQIQVLRAQGKTQEEISKMLGEDAYNYITQTSTAEKLAEVMNKIKQVFVEFVEKSGLIEFLTNPQKIEGFVKSIIDRLAGAVEIIGQIIGGVLDAISHLPGTDALKWQGYANTVREGSAGFGGDIRSMGNSINFGGAPSLNDTVESGKKGEASQSGAVAAANMKAPLLANPNFSIYIDSEPVYKSIKQKMETDTGLTKQ